MPQRFLRPGITTSDAWNAVSWKAQSFYVRILTLVDDFGRYDGRVPILHGECFALRVEVKPQETAALRSELHSSGLITVYSIAGKDYLQVTKWQERSRATHSKYPAPQDSAADGSGAQDSAASLAIAITSSPQRSAEVKVEPLRIPTELIGEEFESAWHRWADFRRQAKFKPYVLAGATAQLSRLAKWGRARAIAAIDYSIANAFQGIYEEKQAAVSEKPAQRPPGPAAPYMAKSSI